jgi:two-component system alkaline phosphatase synthesis response regulator PhoP
MGHGLRREGLAVVLAYDGERALSAWRVERPDVVVASLDLPRLRGDELCRRIRAEAPTGLILLGERNEQTALAAFRLGADDYVAQPFNLAVLAMRIRAVARRATVAPGSEDPSQFAVGDWLLDTETHEARRDDRAVRLTPTEFRLLELLARNVGRVIPSGRLVEHARGFGEADTALLKTHLSHLRAKLALPKAGPGSIAAVTGVGYRLVAITPSENSSLNVTTDRLEAMRPPTLRTA